MWRDVMCKKNDKNDKKGKGKAPKDDDTSSRGASNRRGGDGTDSKKGGKWCRAKAFLNALVGHTGADMVGGPHGAAVGAEVNARHMKALKECDKKGESPDRGRKGESPRRGGKGKKSPDRGRKGKSPKRDKSPESRSR